jgi:hypothetical protein
LLALAFNAGGCCCRSCYCSHVAAVTVAVVIVPIAVIALAFVLRHHPILLSRQLVVTCCFASVTGIFAAHPSFGQLLCLLCIAMVVKQMTMPHIAKVGWQKAAMPITEVARRKTTPRIPMAVAVRLNTTLCIAMVVRRTTVPSVAVMAQHMTMPHMAKVAPSSLDDCFDLAKCANHCGCRIVAPLHPYDPVPISCQHSCQRIQCHCLPSLQNIKTLQLSLVEAAMATTKQ